MGSDSAGTTDTDAGASRLHRLFDAVLAQPPEARAAWIATQVEDPGEQDRLRRLLDGHAAAGLLDTPAAIRAARIGEPEPSAPEGLLGQRIGGFRLLRLLGQGGMATVFLGRREDADFDQQVAVKLLRRGLYSELEQRLFRRERQALALLAHPNIAHLIDGGVTDAGIPYLVLEYVDGVPLTEHVRARQPDLRERLRLFLPVCRAVGAAHRQLIVHRDLKPSNILVTADGTVKLLDFGIAKLLDDDDATRTALAAMTPEYAAPEQLAGLPVSTATDVYALGVLLHELLAGARPQRNTTRRPSQQAPALRGDLDNILLKTLAPEPERRYASALALAEDIERHLDGLPVAAHPPSRWYRVGKFVQRHRGGVLLTTLFALGVFASLGVALWQAQVARREAARAHTTQAFLFSLFEPVRAGMAADQAPTLEQLVDTGIRRLQADPSGDVGSRADLTAMFSRVTAHLGRFETSGRLSAQAYRLARAAYGRDDPRTLAALAQRGRLSALRGDFDAAQRDIAAALGGMRAQGVDTIDRADAMQDLARLYGMQGRHAEAVAVAKDAYGLVLRLAGPDAPELATAMNNLGHAYNDADDVAAGLRWQQRAYDLHVRLGEGRSRAALIALGNLAGGKFQLGRWREARADLDTLLDESSGVSGGLRGLWSDEAQACSVATALADFASAEAHCAAALVAARGPDAGPRPQAIALLFRGALRVQQGRYPEARADIDDALARLRALPGDQQRYLLMAAGLRAEMVRLGDDPAAVAPAFAALVAMPGFERGARCPPVALAQLALACTRAAGACDARRPRWRAEALLARRAWRGHPCTLPAVTALALAGLDAGNAAARERPLREALAGARRELGAGHPWMGEAQAALAQVAAAAGDHASGEAARREAGRIARGLPAQHPLRARLLAHR